MRRRKLVRRRSRGGAASSPAAGSGRCSRRVSLQVVLVLRLGLPEVTAWLDLGYDFAGPDSRGVDVGDGVLGDPSLLVTRIEDGGTVASANVVALAVPGRRVVDLEEEFEDVPETDGPGVEDDLDRLGVTGVVPVGRVLVLPARVSDPRRDDALRWRSKSCTPQKQPPARMAVSAYVAPVIALSPCLRSSASVPVRSIQPDTDGVSTPQVSRFTVPLTTK